MEIHVNEIQEKENQIFSVLLYSSYASNRDNGMTHEQLLRIGIGNDLFKIKYDEEKKNNAYDKSNE